MFLFLFLLYSHLFCANAQSAYLWAMTTWSKRPGLYHIFVPNRAKTYLKIFFCFHAPTRYYCTVGKNNNVALLCGHRVQKIFSTSDDAKRVRKCVFSERAKASFEEIFHNRFWHHHDSRVENIFRTTRRHCNIIDHFILANLTKKFVKSIWGIIIELYCKIFLFSRSCQILLHSKPVSKNHDGNWS